MHPKDPEKMPVCGRGLPPFKKTGKAVFSVPQKDINADILIIGGGIAGLLCAYELSLSGRSPVVCEMNGIGGGSTAFAPPYLLPFADISMRSLTRKYGHAEASRTYGELRRTLDDAKHITEVIGGDCGFTPRDTFLFAEAKGSEAAINEEYRLRKYSGFPCEKLSGVQCEEMFSFRAGCGIYEKNGGAEINLPLFCENLAEYLHVKGVDIYEYSPVTELLKTSVGFSATVADDRAVIKTKTVIDCRGLRQKLTLLKNAVIYSAVSAPKNDFFGWENRCILKKFGRAPLIACTTADNRIYIEGFPNKRLLGKATSEFCFSGLEAAADEMFFGIPSATPSHPGMQTFYERVFSVSADGLPYMGRVPDKEGLYRVYASGRCGTVAAILAAKLIAGTINGDKRSAARLAEYETF